MNASLWQLAGWTMIHSLWLGAAVALAGGFLRLAGRRAAPNARYAISLATLAALALTPLAAAAWLSVNGVPVIDSVLLPPPGGSNEHDRQWRSSAGGSPSAALGWGGGQPGYTASHPSLTLPLKERESEEHVAGQVIDLAHTSPSPRYSAERLDEGQNPPSTTPQPSATVENPSPNSSLPGRGAPPPTYSPTHLLTYSLPHLPTLWLIGAPLTFTLLATGLLGSARLRRRATPLTAGPAFDACERLRQTLKITRRVALAACDGVAQPILVGVLRPLILLPTAALAGWTPEQLDMVLLHELAHVRRWDNLVNLLQRIVESLLFFHPAVWLLSRQVRRDREECCDAAVIRHTNRPHQYAELLVTIAAALRGGPAPSLAVASAMASHPLAGRIRRILNLEEEPMRITRRTLAATLLLPLLLAGAIFYSGASAEDAQNPPPSKEQPSTVASGERAQGGSDPDDLTTKDSAKPNDDDPVYRMTYGLDSFPSNVDLRQWMEIIASDPRIEIQWQPKEKRLVLSAPESRHQELSDLFKSARDVTPADDSRTQVEIPQLQNEIRRLEDLIVKAQKDLVDIEVFKEMSVKNANNPEVMKAAIDKELEKDPTLNMNEQQLFELNSQLQARLSASKNPDDADIKRLRASMQEAEAELAKHRSEAESELREKIAKMPNEVLRSAMTEYKIRRKAVENNLAEHQQELAAAKTKLAQLTNEVLLSSPYRNAATTGSNANAAPAAPKPSLIPAAPAPETYEPSDHLGITVLQPPKWIDRGGRFKGNTWTTTYLKVPAPLPLDYFDEERVSILKAALASEEVASLQTVNKQTDAVTWLQQRLHDSVDGEVLTLQLRYGDGPDDEVILEAVIDAFIAGMKAWASPAKAVDAPPTVTPAGGPGSLNQDAAAAPVQKPAPSTPNGFNVTAPPSPSPFPTLENQKIADRAYKLLGLELEPLSAEDLERVKKLGYSGGLKVAQVIGETGGANGRLQVGNLLVGLHVWPVTDLASLDEILRRPDLGELAPLKYYAVREVEGGTNSSKTGDELTTGRLSIPEAALLSRDLASTDRLQAEMAAIQVPSDVQQISVMQPPTSQKTSIFGGTVTTAYLKVKFDRLPGAFSGPPGAFTNADVPLTPQGIAIQAQNCIEIVKSPSVLKAALAALTPRETVDMKPADAVEWLRNRLSATFPGDGEIFELRLDGGDAKEDSVLLQAVIDAFLAAMKSPPESPADPNAATDAATVPPSDLSTYGGRYVNIASTTSDYQHPDAFLRASLRSRESGKPVVVHLLAHNSEPSRRFVDEVLADAEVSDFIAQNFEPVTIYAEDEPAFAKAFHINLVPANMFVFAGGDRTTGGIAPPATPAHYLAHLKTHHKLATTPAIQNGDAPLAPAAPIAPAADHPGAENKPIENDKPAASVLQPGDAVALKVVGAFPEAPLDGVFIIEPEGTLPLGPLYGRVAIANKPLLEAEAAVKEYLGKTLTDIAVQLTLAPNLPTAESSPPPAAVSPPTFLYDGKTFDQWRDLWKLELNPERRTEAISAMAAFSRAGSGKEAAEAILDVAAEYPGNYAVNSPEAQLRSATEAAIVRMPAELWLPPLMKRMAEDNAKWRRLASQLLYGHYERSRNERGEAQTSPETIALLKLMAHDPKYGPNALPLDTLIRLLPKGDMELDQLISEALAGEDTQNAVHVVGNLSYSRLDQFPEQFEFLFHNDPEIRRYARRVLPQASAKDAIAVADRLKAVLTDPQRSAEHADAVRAMGELIRSIAKGGASGLGSSVLVDDYQEKFRRPIESLLVEGPPELLAPCLVALGHKADDSSLIEQQLGDGLSAERKSLIQETLKKLTAEEKEVLPRQLGF